MLGPFSELGSKVSKTLPLGRRVSVQQGHAGVGAETLWEPREGHLAWWGFLEGSLEEEVISRCTEVVSDKDDGWLWGLRWGPRH